MDWVENAEFESWGPLQHKDKKMPAAVVLKDRIRGRRKRSKPDKLDEDEPPAKKPSPSIQLGAGFKWNLQTLANAADAVESGGKSPVSALNELGVKVHYTVLRQGGPAHCPSFTVAVTVADMTFEGRGHSKREARASAARACLSALMARAGRVLPAPSLNQDFTSDEPSKYPVSEFQCLETKTKVAESTNSSNSEETNGTTPNGNVVAPRASSPTSSPSTALFGSTAASAANKSPINVLYEKYCGLTFTCTFGDGSSLDVIQAPVQLSHSMRFKVICQIKEHKFEGYGSSKKLAKLAAARSALAALDEGRTDILHSTALAGFLHQTLADHIGKLVNKKFNELMKNDVVHSKRKVLAGIVITINHKIEDARVIAVTTGTKCVSGEHMSVTGRAVNDCHAEVAARRCLQRHLYAQLLMYANQPDPRVPIPENDLEPAHPSGYQLKSDRQVHLYISTAPCGDGRIFSPHEQQDGEPDRHPNRLARGQLRTKIESGEGTIPVKNCNNIIQTWDGVMQGERLLTMSCSDKVARWCVVGLQGSLLSRLISPVYLYSLVLGSLLHPHHMYRAICGRIEAYISSLPPPFRLHRPLVARAASTEARTPARAPSFSVCWCSTTPLPEVINAITGKLESGQPSLLCKQSMFARWQYLVKKLPNLPQETDLEVEPASLPEDLDTMLYNEAKQLCPTYQLAKNRLIEAFEKAKLGSWIKKPIEQDQFICEITTADPNALFAWAGVYLHAWDSTTNVVVTSGINGHGSEKNYNKNVQSEIKKRNRDGRNKREIENVKNGLNEVENEKSNKIEIVIKNNKNTNKIIQKDRCVLETDKNKELNNYATGLITSISTFNNYKIQISNHINNSFKNNSENSNESINKNRGVSRISNKLLFIRDINSRYKNKTIAGCNTAQLNKISELDRFKENKIDKEFSNDNKYTSNSISKIKNDVSNILNGNQSVVYDSHLVGKEVKNRFLMYGIGRGRGRLNMLINNNVNVGCSVSKTDAVPSFKSSVEDIENHKEVNNLKHNEADYNKNRKIMRDIPIKDVQKRMKDLNLGDEKIKFWREFYKKRQEKRTILCENPSNIDLEMLNLSSFFLENNDVNNNNFDSRTSKVACSNFVSSNDTSKLECTTSKYISPNLEVSKKEYRNFNPKTLLNLKKIENQAINLDGDINEFMTNTYK